MTDQIITAKLPTIEACAEVPAASAKPKKLARERDIVFFDIETSGLDPSVAEILEIAAIRLDIDSLDEIAAFESRVFPKHIETASPEALVINGYDPDLWSKTAVSVEEALRQFVDICGGQVTLAGHNPGFDWSFCRPRLVEIGLLAEVDYHIIDTSSLAWPIAMSGAIDRVKLQVVCDHLGIDNAGEHRALTDCRRAAEAYRRMMRMYDWNEVHARTAIPLIDACKRIRDVWESVKKLGSVHDEDDILAAVGQLVLPALKGMEASRNDHATKQRLRADAARAKKKP